jgi:hypothetical protein
MNKQIQTLEHLAILEIMGITCGLVWTIPHWPKSTEYPVVMFFWTNTNKEFPGNRKTLCIHIKVCPNEAVRLKKDT